MKESLTRMLGAAGTLLLIGLFVVAAAPARAEGVGDRITALEEELTQLKGEQAQMRTDALAAKAKLPTFSYREGRGMAIWGADKSWGFRTKIRWHMRLNFFPDKDAIADNGFAQWNLNTRRMYPYFTYWWDKGFYEIDFQLNLSPNRSVTVQKAEFRIKFNKINPWLPFLSIGPRLSAFHNKHDNNWSSSSGGSFDRTMFWDGTGAGAGTQVNGIGLDWRNLPMGPGVIRILQFGISNQGIQNQATTRTVFRAGKTDRVLNQQNSLNDNKAFHAAIWMEPFKKSKNKWIKGIDYGMSVQLEDIHKNSTGKGNFQVRTTERIRLRLISIDKNARGLRVYLTPGFGWKIGPYWLRTALGFNQGHFSEINGGRTTPGTGSRIYGKMWTIKHELWLWSPKGLFTGSTKRAGSLQWNVGFERDDYRAPNGKLEECSSITRGGNCTSAHATLAQTSLWYFFRHNASVGVEYGHYRVNKIGEDGNELRRDGEDKRGDSVKFNTLEFGLRVEW